MKFSLKTKTAHNLVNIQVLGKIRAFRDHLFRNLFLANFSIEVQKSIFVTNFLPKLKLKNAKLLSFVVKISKFHFEIKI